MNINMNDNLFCKPLIDREIKKWQNFAQGQRIAQALQVHGIPAVTAISYQLDENKKFAVYPWIEGTVLSSAAASAEQAFQIGALLARIHQINLQLPDIKPVVWQDALANKEFYSKGEWVVSHGDLIQGNVIWTEKDFYIIDWDSAGLIHPQIELLGVALNWSGVNVGDSKPDIFSAVLEGYRSKGGVVAIDKKIFYTSLNSWVAWLEYNIEQAALGIDVSEEIKNTIKTLERLQSVGATGGRPDI